MNRLLRSSLGLAACTTAAVIAYAAIEFNAADGTGFVGKGDVQIQCGYNNAQLQRNAAAVSFQYQEIEQVEQDCQDGQGQNKTVVGVRTRTTKVTSQVARDLRLNKNNDVTGFNLIGFGEVVDESVDWNGGGTGNGCPAGSNPVGPQRVLPGATSGFQIVCP